MQIVFSVEAARAGQVQFISQLATSFLSRWKPFLHLSFWDIRFFDYLCNYKGGEEKFWQTRLTASPSPVHQCIHQAQVKMHLYQVQAKVVMASLLHFWSLISSLEFPFFILNPCQTKRQEPKVWRPWGWWWAGRQNRQWSWQVRFLDFNNFICSFANLLWNSTNC